MSALVTPPRLRRIRGGEILNSPSESSSSNSVPRLPLRELFPENNATPTRTPRNRRNVISTSTQQTPFRNDGTKKVLYYIGYENGVEWIEIHINDIVLMSGHGFFQVTDIKGTIITLHNLDIGKNYEIDMKQTRDGDGYRSQGYIVIFRRRGVNQLGPSPPLMF
jgi:hypothetical protein